MLLFIFYIIITFSVFSNICLFAFVVFLPSMDISILMADNRGEDNGCEKRYHCALINLVLASIRFFDVNLKNKKYCNKVRCLKLFFIYVQIKFQYILTYSWHTTQLTLIWVYVGSFKANWWGGGGERGVPAKQRSWQVPICSIHMSCHINVTIASTIRQLVLLPKFWNSSEVF